MKENKLSVWKFPYKKTYYLTHPWKWFYDLYWNFRNFWHRERYGFAYIDVWELNNQNNGAIGVSFDKNANKWKAEFQRFGKYFNAGTFDTKEQAIEARIKAINEVEKNADKLLFEYEEKNCNKSIGVRPSPHGRWVAKFYRQNKTYHVGTFDTQEEAVAARLRAVKNFEARKKVV
jgi:hypothetical protein